MPDFRRQRCRVNKGGCGKSAAEVGPISWRGLCGECGPARANRNADDLHYHQGEGFEQWRRAMAASVGGVLLDDVLADTHTDGRG